MVVNDETSTSRSSAPIVVRGSAPQGTFQIPDDGLRFDSSDSFLSRFKSSIRLRSHPKSFSIATAKPDVPADPSPAASNSTSRSSTQSNVCLTETNVSAPHSASSPRTSLDPISPGSKSPTDGAPSTHASTSHVVFTRPSQAHMSEHSDRPHSSEDQIRLTHDSKHISAEQAADEVEDTLIQVNPDGESLQSSSRHSYPILRFCSATALLQQSLLDKVGLPIGFVWTPFGHLPDVPHVTNQPLACTTCGALLANANGGETVLQGAAAWPCGFCGRSSDVASSLTARIMSSPHISQLSSDVFTFLQPTSAPSNPSPYRPATVLIIDENFSSTATEFVRTAAIAVRNLAVSRSDRFVLLTVGAGCSAVPSEVLQSTIPPTVEVLSSSRVAAMSHAEKSRYIYDGSLFASESLFSQDGLSTLFENIITPRLRPYGGDDWHQSASASTSPNFEAKSSLSSPSSFGQRCLHVAISIAFDLLTGTSDLANSRIISLISGPPTLDKRTKSVNNANEDVPEATRMSLLSKLYESLGLKALELKLCLDFLVLEEEDGFAAKVLLGAARRSKGGTVYCAAHSFTSPQTLADAAVYLASRPTMGGVVSLRVSSPFVIARVIGPAFPTASAHTYSVSSVDPSIGFTVVLKGIADDKHTGPNDVKRSSGTKNGHAVIQLSATSGGICRVVTVRVPIAPNLQVFLSSIDVEVSSVVLGKACVVSGGGVTKPEIVAASVDATVRQLVENGGQPTAGITRLLYDLRFGPLVEGHFQTDQSVMLRSLFLRTECVLAALLMSPRLFTNAVADGKTGMMTEVPLERKFVNEASVVVLDTGVNVFVFAGKNSDPDAVRAISESARNVVSQRALPCQLWELSHDSSVDPILKTYLWNEDRGSANAGPAGKRRTREYSGNEGFTEYLQSLVPKADLSRVLRVHHG